MKRIVISSETSASNTAESDMQRLVMHDVRVCDEYGKECTVKIMAECPIDAQTKVNNMSDERFDLLTKF